MAGLWACDLSMNRFLSVVKYTRSLKVQDHNHFLPRDGNGKFVLLQANRL